MNKSEKQILVEAVEELDNYFSNRCCNDYELKDTPENRQIIKEYQAWNLRVPLDEVESHKEYGEPNMHKGNLFCHDSVMIYVLKKNLGLL